MEIIDILTSWDQYKKSNWFESDAIDVEKMLMNQFVNIFKHEKNVCLSNNELNHVRQWFNTTIDKNQDKDILKTEWELGLKIHNSLNIKPENRIVKNCNKYK